MSDTEAAAAADAGDAGAANAVPQAELEGRARRMGWRPKEEFRGDPQRWTDAGTFVERGESELPVLRERYRALDDRFAKLESAHGEVKSGLSTMTKTFQEYVEFSKKSEERAYARAKTEIEARMAQAVETADRDSYRQAKSEMDDLERSKPQPAAAAARTEQPQNNGQQQIDPAVTRWVSENRWYETDPDLNDFATARHMRLLRERPGLTMAENLEEVGRATRERFPDKFGNARREAPAAVADPSGGVTSTAGGGKKKGKSFADLPQEAKAAYERFKKQMPDYKQDQYATMYFAGEE